MEELASRGHQVDKESVVLIFQNIHATHSSCKLNTAEGFIDTISWKDVPNTKGGIILLDYFFPILKGL